MLDKFNRHRARRKPGQYRSQLEQQIALDLLKAGCNASYEKDRFKYTITKAYTPDFRVGDFFIEVKGWWPSSERSKFLAVVICNPDLPIFVALQRPQQTLSKQSKTTYAQWCDKHGIRWCPTPIPLDFLRQWEIGERPTYRVQTKKDAAVQTELLSQQTTDQSIAFPVASTSRLRRKK